MLKIYNSLIRSKQDFEPITPGKVRMYVCGMTVYDYCHLGHARVMVAFDLVRRWLRASGLAVTYVRNITDIDDKIIKRAQENKEPVEALTARFIQAMNEDADALGVERPDAEPRATGHVPGMLDMIGVLEKKGLAYKAANGDVNYSVRKFPGYGKLSGKSLDDLRAGERVEIGAGKQDPLDFVLWKKWKEGEPGWDSGWGKGRPGWHIECSAMSKALLGEHFDIHGGGQDLQFPHHENEIAQSEGAHGKFVNYWMHNGFVRVMKGEMSEKMSKSLGNFFTVREVLEKYRPEEVRFFIVRAQYRSPLNCTLKERGNDKFEIVELEDAKASLTTLYTALKDAQVVLKAYATNVQNIEIDWNAEFASEFRTAMDDDFNTPDAVKVLFRVAGEVQQLRNALVHSAPKIGIEGEVLRENLGRSVNLLKSLGGILGLLQMDPSIFLQGGGRVLHGAINERMQATDKVDALVARDLSDDEISDLIQKRNVARQGKNFSVADGVRDILKLYGVVLEDSTETGWRRGSAYRLIEVDELEDFRYEVIRHGYSVADFEIKEYPEKNTSGGIYVIRGDIEIKNKQSGTSHRFKAGHGSSWIVNFSNLLVAGNY